MKIHHLSILALATKAAAFTHISTRNTIRTLPTTSLKIATMPNVDILQQQQQSSDNEKGAIKINLDGIAFSGLKGKALSLTTEDFPDRNAVSKVIPQDCYEADTMKSLGYLSVSVIGTALCTAFGVGALGVLDPSNLLTWAFWIPYDLVTG
jgi:hypothetical protein